jgi:hypothetical protein
MANAIELQGLSPACQLSCTARSLYMHCYMQREQPKAGDRVVDKRIGRYRILELSTGKPGTPFLKIAISRLHKHLRFRAVRQQPSTRLRVAVCPPFWDDGLRAALRPVSGSVLWLKLEVLEYITYVNEGKLRKIKMHVEMLQTCMQ